MISVRCVNIWQCSHFWNCSLGCEVNLNNWRWAPRWRAAAAAGWCLCFFSPCLHSFTHVLAVFLWQLILKHRHVKGSIEVERDTLWLFCLFVVDLHRFVLLRSFCVWLCISVVVLCAFIVLHFASPVGSLCFFFFLFYGCFVCPCGRSHLFVAVLLLFVVVSIPSGRFAFVLHLSLLFWFSFCISVVAVCFSFQQQKLRVTLNWGCGPAATWPQWIMAATNNIFIID